MKEKRLRKLIREKVRSFIEEENKGVLYSYAGDIDIYDLTRAPQGRDGAPETGNNIVALKFGANTVKLNPNEAESLFKAVKAIYNSRS